jgi:Trypsin
VKNSLRRSVSFAMVSLVKCFPLMRVFSAFSCLALASSACASDANAPQVTPESDSTSNESDIQRGVEERGYPAVGMLLFRSGSLGTGTLIRPNVVLTAGHVAYGSVETFHYGRPPAGKNTNYTNLTSVKIADKALGDCYARPGYTRPSKCVGDLDIALIKLEKSVTDVTPIPMFDKDLITFDQALKTLRDPRGTAVGFGCYTSPDNKQSFGNRRSAVSIFSSINATEIVLREGTGIASGGDSGGPVLYEGKIMGTVRGGIEFTKDGNTCGRVREGYVRIDQAMPWIREQLRAWGAL